MKHRVLKAERHPFFNVRVADGGVTTTNTHSYYAELPDTEGLTFDAGNQKVLANCDVRGTIRQLTFYRQNTLTEEKPGVWVNKGLAQTADLKAVFKVDGQLHDLSAEDHAVTCDLLSDSLPRFFHEYQKLQIHAVCFAPIVAGKRYSLLIQQFVIVNQSSESITCEFLPLPLYREKYSDQQHVLIRQRNSESVLAPGEAAVYYAGFIDPEAYEEQALFETADLEEWLAETLSYFEDLYGELSMESEMTGYLYRRALYQSFCAFGMTNEDVLVGSNWGSWPATERIWNKDMYYAALPFTMIDPQLCQKTILWFHKYGIKFPGTKFPGGINHSLSNSLSSLLLAALYFENTGDLTFFAENPHILQYGREVVDTVLAQHQSGEPYLFSSVWLSDAFALGKYHTGSNLCLWKACNGLAVILKAHGDVVDSCRYATAAEKIKAAILTEMTTNGPFGEQFLEGIGDEKKRWYAVRHYEQSILEQGLIFLSDVIREDQIDLLMHDGEESDTTLMGTYHFLDWDDPLYQNTMSFAASPHNPTYSSEIRGIAWGQESGATFPGFITLLAGLWPQPDQRRAQLEELAALADLDGSWWWWPYQLDPTRGKVVRNFGCGKCAWGAGMFVTLLLNRYFGLQYADGVLQVTPVPELQYRWRRLRFGSSLLDLECRTDKILLTNRGSEPLRVLRDIKAANVVTVAPNQQIEIVRNQK